MSYLALPWAEKPAAPVVAAALLLVLLGFVVGWIAHRDDERRYRESRERHLARQLAEVSEDHRALVEAVRVPAAPSPAVVHVHMPALYPSWPQTIDAQIVPALPSDRNGVA